MQYTLWYVLSNALVFYSRHIVYFHSCMFLCSRLLLICCNLICLFIVMFLPVGLTAVISGRTVTGDCQGEMLDYRRMLMEDFSLSPEIVLHCRGEIEAHCSGLHRKGRTLHCLMRVARGDKGTVDNLCQTAVRTFGIVGKGIGYLIVFCIF